MRNRMINKQFFTDDSIIELHPNARQLFIAIWIHSSDNGCGSLSHKSFKAMCFPADDHIKAEPDVKTYVDQMLDLKLLKQSTCGKYYKVSNWDLYQTIQRPNHKEMEKYEDISFVYREELSKINEQSMNDHSVKEKNTIENNIIEKNIKEYKDQIPKDQEFEHLFDLFYKNYPRKIQKPKAKKGFKRLNKESKQLLIKRTIDIWVPYWQSKYMKNGKWLSNEFIPHPTSFINGRLFEDEPPIVDDPVISEQHQLKIKEDRLIKEQREQAAYLKRAESLAPKSDKEYKDAISPISDVLKNLRNKHNQAQMDE